MLKSADRPATASEAGLNPPEGGMMANVVMDGKIMEANCKAFGKSVEWVSKEVERQGAKLKDVALATLNGQGQLNFYYKEKGGTRSCLI